MTQETETFLILKYGSLEDAFEVLRDGDERGDYELFDTSQRHVLIEWFYDFLEKEHRVND